MDAGVAVSRQFYHLFPIVRPSQSSSQRHRPRRWCTDDEQRSVLERRHLPPLLRRDDHDVFGLEFDRFVADFQSEPAVEGEVQLLLLAVVMAITGVLFFKHPDVRSHRFPLEFVPDRFPSLIEVVDAPQLEVVEADSAEKRPASTTSSRKKRQTVESAGSVAEPSNREYSRSHLPRRERTCRGSLRLEHVPPPKLRSPYAAARSPCPSTPAPRARRQCPRPDRASVRPQTRVSLRRSDCRCTAPGRPPFRAL